MRENILAEIQFHVSEVLGSGLFFFRKDEGRSAAVEQVQMRRQSQLSVDDQPERVLSVPFAYRERRIVEQGRASSYENRFLFGPHLVNRQGRERSGKAYRVSVFTPDVQKTVGRLCPFQGDVRTLFQVECHESTNQFPAFFFQYTDRHFNAGIPQLLDSSSGYQRKRVHTAYYYSRNPFPYD